MLFFILSLIALEVLAVFFPMVLQEVAIIANRQVESGDTSVWPLIWQGALVLGFITLIFATHFIMEFFANLYSGKYQENMRTDLYNKLSSLSTEQIDEIGTAKILPIILNDTNWMKLYHRRLVHLCVFFPIAILGSFIMLFTLNWIYALFAFASIPFVLLFFWLNLRKMQKVIAPSIQAFDEYFFSIKEGIVGAKEIRILGKADERSQDFEKHVRAHRQQGLTAERCFALSAGFNAILFTLITVAIIIFATLTNRSTGETIVIVQLNTAIQYINRVWGGSHMLFTWFIDIIPRCKFTAKRLDDLYNMPEPAEDLGLKQIPVYKTNNIKLIDLGYTLPNGKMRLEDINIHITEGKILAIAGGIKSGKSLLTQLLLKLKTPTTGTITFNEIDIQQIHSPTWRHDFVAYCHNTPRFVPGTVRDNIKLFNPDATDEQILNTFKEIGAGHFISKMFDNILDFEIKEGNQLAEGIKNILSIVRACLKPAQIYVFNQCFEHVRHTYITKLMAKLKREKKTAIFLTYDGTVCKYCDTIYVLNQGKITGTGTHAELIKSNKDYRELHTSTLGVMVYDEEKHVDEGDVESDVIVPDEQMPAESRADI